MKIQQPVHPRYLYFLSFIEGGSVMSTELIGAKLLAPYFGTSLYVWAATLGLTLGGLMCGYFIGGITSRRFPKNERILFYVLTGAGLFLWLMPYTSRWIMQHTLTFDIQTGASLSLLVYMLPPLLLMGMVSPLIINLLTRQAEEAGNRAGNVYAISTLGGILATFLLGFYIIPEFGITQPAMVNGFLLAAFPIASLLRRRLWPTGLIGLLLLAGLSWQSWTNAAQQKDLLYYSEGVMGQVKVIDYSFPDQNGQQRTARALIVNNTLQTVIDLEDPDYNFWEYSAYLPVLATTAYPPDRVLLLGMGAGVIVRRLTDRNITVDAVEIDERIAEVAAEHFGLPPNQNVIVDDGRHYLKVTPHAYDLIIYDAFKGDAAPEHLITLEGLADARRVLSERGMIMANFYGYLEGELGKVTRSVAQTMAEAGFHVRVLASPGPPDSRNLLLMATRQDIWPKLTPVAEQLNLNILDFDSEEAVILTDEAPQLKLYAKAAARWRKLDNQYYTPQFLDFR